MSVQNFEWNMLQLSLVLTSKMDQVADILNMAKLYSEMNDVDAARDQMNEAKAIQSI
jgi:hypothetical protein